jgi:hypothetical protein
VKHLETPCFDRLSTSLGSASVVTDSTSPIPQTVGEQRYYPYGETRFTSGTIYTDKLFTRRVDWRSRVETGRRLQWVRYNLFA